VIFFNSVCDKLPAGLEEIKFNGRFNQKFEIPDGIKSVSFSMDFKQILERLPEGLEVLILNDDYSHQLPKFPNSLKHLQVGKYTHPICDLPEGFETLIVYRNDDCRIIDLPKSTKKLFIKATHKIIDNYYPSLEEYFWKYRDIIEIEV